MNKISNAQVVELLSDAASTMRAQQAHIQELETKVANSELRDRAEKIAHQMHAKGLETDTSVDALATRLEKAAASDLTAIERAVEIVGPDMGQKIAQLAQDESVPIPGTSDLERFIVGHAG